MPKRFLALCATGLLAACSPTQDLSTVKAAIGEFHTELNAGKIQPIYDSAGPELKSPGSSGDMLQFLGAVHRKLGAFQSGDVQTWNDSITGQGHLVTIGFAAKYDKGPADEQFVYRIGSDGHAQLAGYHINSTALIVN
jgi:hypothetical protein